MNENFKIDPSANIHPSVIMEGEIEIGANTTVGPNAYLKGPLVIGSNNQICAQVMIGVDPEHKTKPGVGCVVIGDGNVIREYSIIQRGIGELDTQIQDNCYIMAYTYIAHDCLIESDCILCARVSLAGHCHVLKGAVLGVAAALHGFSTVGAHAFVGMGSIVVKDVPPFCVVMGNPARFAKLHSYPLESLGLKLEDLEVRNSCLQSGNPYVKECIDNFNSNVRRKVLLIVSNE